MYLGIIPYMGVSKNRGITKSSHFNRVFHYKPSILRYHYFWKHPYTLSNPGPFFHCSNKKFPGKTAPQLRHQVTQFLHDLVIPNQGDFCNRTSLTKKNPDGSMDLLAQKTALKGTCFFSHPPPKKKGRWQHLIHLHNEMIRIQELPWIQFLLIQCPFRSMLDQNLKIYLQKRGAKLLDFEGSNSSLPGGFNPFEHISQIGSSPQVRIKKMKPPASSTFKTW